MTYLSAFGHSLRAEISRIETVSSDVAKGKFISSVSHELRTLPSLRIYMDYSKVASIEAITLPGLSLTFYQQVRHSMAFLLE
jgi:hypothetical protein